MTLKLKADLRTKLGKKSRITRSEGKIPAVVYGHGLENKNLELDYTSFDKVFKAGGESTIIDLNINDELLKVVVADVQYDPVKSNYSHVDFHNVKMDEEITASVELNFIGEARMVKESGGVLVHNISEIEIKCLPGDLVGEIDVDISKLDTFEDVITIADLVISSKIEIIGHEPTDVVAMVSRPRAEEVETTPEVISPDATSSKTEVKTDKKDSDKK